MLMWVSPWLRFRGAALELLQQLGLCGGGLGTPANVASQDHAPGEVLVTWEAGADAEAHLIVVVKAAGGGLQFKVAGPEAQSQVLTGLETGQSYRIIVIAFRQGDAGLEYEFSSTEIKTGGGSEAEIVFN